MRRFATRALRRAAIAAAVALFLFCLVFVSFSPAVPVQRRPSAQDIQAARTAWRQLKLSQGASPTEVRFDERTVSGLSALARDASGVERIDAALSEAGLRGRASIALPLGLWLNASASTDGDHSGFPRFRLTVGRLDLPAAAGRPLARLVRWVLRRRGADLPPLDDIVRRFSVARHQVLATVRMPSRTGLVDGVLAARGGGTSRERVEAIFCRLGEGQRAQPVATLSELVRRTFAEPSSADSQNDSRAAFVALALAVVGERAEPLVAGSARLRRDCPFPEAAIRLHGRRDLAKHWAFSAALTAVFGGEAAENLGEWKELDDSLPEGSGFSFVDLAADRAGVRTALRALAPASAAATLQALRRATDEQMMPSTLLEGVEGLSDAAFVDRFGSLEEERYREAVIRIDRMLAEQRRRSPAG